MIVLRYYGLIIVSFISFQLSYSQDTLSTGENEELIDTVVIYKDPIVVKKTVYYEEEVKKSKNGVWVELIASPFYTINYHLACPGYETYLGELNKSTSPLPGYSFGVNLLFFYKNLLLTTGVGYASFREKFRYQSSTESFNLTNAYQYANIPLLVGYRILNKGEFQAIVSGGAIIGKLLSVKGKTHSEEDVAEIKDIDDVRKYYSYNYQGVAKFKLIYRVSHSIHAGVEPCYFADIRSITPGLEPFIQHRNNLGLSANLIFVLK